MDQSNRSKSHDGESDDVPWDAIEAMQNGAPLLKFGRAGDPHFRLFRLSEDCTMLTWVSPKKADSDASVRLSECRLVTGQTTDVFSRHATSSPLRELGLSLSLVYPDPRDARRQRSLDVVCKDREEFWLWVRGLRFLVEGPPSSSALSRRRTQRSSAPRAASRLEARWQAGVGGGAVPEALPSRAAASWVPEASAELSRELQRKIRETNDVYAWGWGAWGQLGSGGEASAAAPQLVPSLLGRAIATVACGESHTLALSDAGECFAWGHGGAGRLGLGSTVPQPTPRPVLDEDGRSRVFALIAAGERHSLAVDKSGAVFAWGDNGSGQLMVGDCDPRLRPTKVDLPEAAAGIAGGGEHSMVVDVSGRVYAGGGNDCYALGLGEDGPAEGARVVLPVRVRGFAPLPGGARGHAETTAGAEKGPDGEEAVAAVACGLHHSAAVTESGRLLTWGWNGCGQLGLGDVRDRHAPTTVRSVGLRVRAVACGAAHTVVIADASALKQRVAYAFGSSAEGQLGHPHPPQPSSSSSTKRQASFVPIPAPIQLTPAGAAGKLTPVRDHDQHSYLAAPTATPTDVTAPTILDNIAMVACGTAHTVLLRDGGSLYVCGTGHLGQLGISAHTNTNAPTQTPSSPLTNPISVKASALPPSSPLNPSSQGPVRKKSVTAALLDSSPVPPSSPSLETSGAKRDSGSSSLSATSSSSDDSDFGEETQEIAQAAAAALRGGARGSFLVAPGMYGRVGVDHNADALRPRSISAATSNPSTMPLPSRAMVPDAIDEVLNEIEEEEDEELHHDFANPSPTRQPVSSSSFDRRSSLHPAASAADLESALFLDETAPRQSSAADHIRMSSTGVTDDSSSSSLSAGDEVVRCGGVPTTRGVGLTALLVLDRKVARFVACGGAHTAAAVATEWIGDEEAPACMRCALPFTIRRRRHHCRACGGVYCARCSGHRVPILRLAFVDPVRVCDGCFSRLRGTNDDPGLGPAALKWWSGTAKDADPAMTA